MRFTCEKAILQSCISITARTVAVKSPIPSLEGILIEAGETLQFTGYNTKTGIRTVVGADIQEQGSIVVSSRLLGEIVRRLPDEMVSVSVQREVVTIRCGVSEFRIQGTDAEEYPSLPNVEYQNTITLEQGALMGMLNQTLFAVGHDESRAIQTGELFELDEEGVLTVVAVDGYRLALRREKVQGGKPCSFVIPAASLIEVSKICSDSQDPVDIVQGERHIMFKAGNVTLIARRLEGNFLDYRGSIPKESSISIVAERKAMISAIERCALIITEQQKSPLRCTLDGDVLRFQTATALGTVYDECAVVGSGTKLEIGFNDRYMLDALKAAPSEMLRLCLNNQVSPCVILPEEGMEENFLYMVLPVRLRSGV